MSPVRRFILWSVGLAAFWGFWAGKSLLGWELLGGHWNVIGPLLSVVGLLTALAHSFRVFPYRTALYLAAIPGLTSLVMFLKEDALALVIGADVVLVVFALLDLFTLPRRGNFSVERTTGRIVSLGQTHRVQITVSNFSDREVSAECKDCLDQDLQPHPAEVSLRLSGRSRASFQYTIRPRRRGAFTLPSVQLRVHSRYGIWQRILEFPEQSLLHVYPDLKQLARYSILARTNRLALLGLRRTRRIGQDNEFERLRDYTHDDNYKHIDWRTTARRNKLTVKDFQTNQSQRVIFLIDCGRMMTNEAAGLCLLDHAFNAMLMLSFIALSKGDSVGLLCFSDEITGFVPPQSGKRHMNRLLHTVFDLFPRRVESRYDEAFLYLRSHHPKRSLVVLITSVIDEVNAHQVERHLATLVGKHLPMGVLLRDRRMFDAAECKVPSDRPLFDGAVAAEILLWRRQVLADLESKGVLSLDVFPEEMTAPLINRYLEIKARHLL